MRQAGGPRTQGGRCKADRRPVYPGGQVQGEPEARVLRGAGPRRAGGPRTQGGKPEAGRRLAYPGGQARGGPEACVPFIGSVERNACSMVP